MRAHLRLLAILLFPLLSACGERSLPTPPQSSPSAPVAGASPTGLDTLTYFDTHCASCHGPYGDYYNRPFAAATDDDALARIVREMTAGPGQSPLEGEALAALTAFHRALAADEPFLVITSYASGTLRGEVSPGSSVFVLIDDAPVPATVDGHTWSLILCDQDDRSAWIVTAERAGKTTRITHDPGFSHPGPDPTMSHDGK
ncbi:MAG: hypothetical protein H7Y88_07280 [Phycisphaerales bacterium]|nr:hypothetical protein [Phycisphaerales bacterium]